jgi:hypothetical protein
VGQAFQPAQFAEKEQAGKPAIHKKSTPKRVLLVFFKVWKS